MSYFLAKGIARESLFMDRGILVRPRCMSH